MLWALIMAGGQGTRFWPESRRHHPKQFLRIFGKKSLLEQTVARLKGVIPPSRIFVVTQREKESFVSRVLGIPRANIIGEPVGRNTAPCAALVAALVRRKDEEGVLAILPSDHHIEKEERFRRALGAAFRTALEKKLPVTFGIQPDSPHTGYGYLETERYLETRNHFRIYRLKQFHEKPGLERAQAYLKAKRFYWNSGMFVWHAGALLEATRAYLPAAYRIAVRIVSGDLKRGMARDYAKMPNISIDYGPMEKMKGRILTLPVEMGWNDVGDWKSVSKFWAEDKDRNAVLGTVLLIDSSGNVVKGSRRVVALVGVHDHVVVDTEDALLIVPKHKTESIRQVVEHLRLKKMHGYL